MHGKSRRIEKHGYHHQIIALSMTAAILVMGMAVLAGCAHDKESDASQAAKSASAENPSDTKEKVITDATRPISLKDINGIAFTSIKANEQEELLTFLDNQFFDLAESEKHEYVIDEIETEDTSARAFRLKNIATGVDYLLQYDEQWSIETGFDTAYEKLESTERKDEPLITPDGLKSNFQDTPTELHSSETKLDELKTWPVSHAKTSEIIPAEIAEALQTDISGFLAQHGVTVDNPLNILVSEEGVERDASSCTFYTAIYSGVDRIVIKAEYNTVDKSHTFTLMP